MKRGCLIGIIIGSVVLLFVIGMISWGVRSFNQMVTMQESVTSQWGNVETQYQRRMDLIPNFVNTVKGAANFEQQTLTQVIEARAKATSVNINADNLNEQTMTQFQQAQGEISSALARLMVVVEKYPELKATQNFRDLQVELEGSENRISKARTDFNDIARTYNTFIRKFPQSFIAGMFNFDEKPYFKAVEGADVAPEVTF